MFNWVLIRQCVEQALEGDVEAWEFLAAENSHLMQADFVYAMDSILWVSLLLIELIIFTGR